MNEVQAEQIKGFEDLISAIFRQAVDDEIYSLTHYQISDISVKEFIETGQFYEYAHLLIALDANELLDKFWSNIAYQTVKSMSKSNREISELRLLSEAEEKAFKKYL